MSMLEHASRSIAAGRSGVLSEFGPSALLRSVATLYGAWRGRRQVLDMREFDDAQLADIGLMRSDLENALQAPLGADPSHYLVRARQDPLRGLKRF